MLDIESKNDKVETLIREFLDLSKRRGYSKKQISKLAGVRFGAIYQWINGKSLPRSAAIIERIKFWLDNNNVKEDVNVTASSL